MLDYKIDCLPNIIYLGRQTENNVREIRVDCTAWLERWPDLIISAYVTPPDRGSAYLANTRMDGNVLCWTVDASDTARSGTGTVEFLGVADGLRKLSAACQTLIHATTTGTTSEPPEADKPWIDRVITAADMVERKERERESAEAARATAEDQRASAETARENAEAARVAAEQNRAASESMRAAAENARVAAETERAETFAGYEARINAATPDDNALNGKPWTSRKIVDTLCPPFEVSGSAVTCHPVERYPLGVVSRIEPVQSGSGDPSPDNVRPISGWDSVHVTRCGKNLLKASKSDITRELNGIVGNYTANNDTFAIKGTNKASSNFLILSITPYVYPYFKPGDKYTILNNSPNGVYINLTYINTSGNIASLVYNDTQTTFTVPEDYIRLNKLQVGISTSVSTIDTTFNVQLEVGSTATAYEPYTGDIYTAELPETIYGGELDWNTGVLTVDRRITIADGTVNKFTPDRVGDFWNMPFKSAPGTIDVVGVQNSHFEKNKFGLNGYNEYLFTMPAYMNGLFDTADNLNAYLVEQNASGTPVTFVYKLKMPYTIQITPQQIAALTGINTLYTDSGDTAVSGRADPVWLTQSLMERIAALESAATNI